MLISPLLQEEIVLGVSFLLERGSGESKIVDLLKDLPIEEAVHVLRFIYNKDLNIDIHLISTIWHTFIPRTHPLNTRENLRALNALGKWWDTFGSDEDISVQQYDAMELLLDTLGSSPEGKDYFKWVALYPVNQENNSNIWDEHRRGAIVCLGKYAYSKETELFLARHLDDWNTIQVEVVQILAAMKSRLLAKIAPWYLKNDDLLKEILEEYF